MDSANIKRNKEHLNCDSRANHSSVKTAQMRSTFSISLLLFVTLLLSSSYRSHGKKAINPYGDSESKDDSSLVNGKKKSSFSVGEDERKRRQTDINNLLPPNTIKDKIEKEKRSRKLAIEKNQGKSSNNQNNKAGKSDSRERGREGAVTVDVNTDGTTSTSKTNKKESSRGQKDSQIELKAVQPKSKGSEALDEDDEDDDYDDDYYDDDYDDYYDDDDYDDYYDDDHEDDDYDDYGDNDDYDDDYSDDDYDDDYDDSQLDLDLD